MQASKIVLVVVCMAVVASLVMPSTSSAQTPPSLGPAQQFGVLGGSAVTGATGSGVLVRGDVGSSPTPSISNFPPSSTANPFIVHNTNDQVVQEAHLAAATAYTLLQGQGPGTVLPDNLATVGALGPGSYSFVTGAADLPASATLTLNGSGIFIFNVDSSLTANVLSSVVGTANPCNVYWRVGSSATLNGTNFVGTVVAKESITVGAGSSVAGRALALDAAVTMAGSGGNTIGGCSSAPVCPLITILPPTLPNGQIGVAYAQMLTFTGIGSNAPHTFSVVSGTLPAGVTLTPAGLLSGTPTRPGSTTVTIRLAIGNGCVVDITYTIGISGPSCPVITMAPPTLPAGVQGTPYSQTFTASGGTGAYVFSVSAGTLPAGLTLSPGGVLSGTPTAPAAATFTIRATDESGCFAERPYTVGIAAPGCPVITVTPPTLPNGTLGEAYSQTITASGGTAPYVFTVSSGTLPAGLTLTPAGVLAGTPTTLGSSTVSIQASDGAGCPGIVTYTITTVGAVPTLPWPWVLVLAVGLAGMAYVRLRRTGAQ
jgi:hypothetical protein